MSYVIGMAQWDAAAGRVRQVIVAKVMVDEINGDDDDVTSVPINKDSLFSCPGQLNNRQACQAFAILSMFSY